MKTARKLLLCVLSFLLCLTAFSGCKPAGAPPARPVRPANERNSDFIDVSPGDMTPLSMSRNRLIAMLSEGYNEEGYYAEIAADDADALAPSAGNGGGDYAATNVQHEGVDEGDIIKVDCGYIYLLSQEGLVIVSVQDTLKITCKIKYDNFYPDEMFIFGDRLVVIGGIYSQFTYNFGGIIDDGLAPWYGYRTSTKIIVYDLKNRVGVTKLAEYDISGYYVTSRLIESRLTVTVNHTINRRDKDSYIPTIDGQEINSADIYVYNTPDGYQNYYYAFYTIIASIDVSTLKVEAAAHLGLQGVAYFSKNNAYFFNSVYKYTHGEAEDYSCRAETFIVKIALNTLLYCASARIDGQIYDRYWADEYEENLRVVTLTYKSGYFNGAWVNEISTNVFVLDKDLNALGTITGIASGENIYAVRFNKSEGSIVTFLNIDPLFKLNLSDPRNPKISDGLKEDGVSDYLQYLSDDVILGLGRNTEPNRWGGTSFSGMKISLYDNTGGDAVNMSTVDIGTGRVNSEALWNPKAILNDTARNMFSFAVTDYGDNDWRNLTAQGLAVFEYDLTAEENSGKLIYRGLLTNVGTRKTYSAWEDYYDDFYAYVKRGARIGNRIYTISERYIASYDIDGLNLIQRIKISDIHVHRMGAERVEKKAACYESGVSTKKCTVDGCGFESAYTTWAAHDLRYQITKAASCAKSGSRTVTCANRGCGLRYEETLPPQHTMGNRKEIRAASCTENGAYTMTCSVKGCGFKQEYILWAAGHSLRWRTAVAPTCTEDGLEIASCDTAGCNHTQTRIIFASHLFSAWTTAKAATCAESGIQTSSCIRPGCSHSRTQIVWPDAHDWGHWISGGSRTETRTCRTDASHKESRLIWI